MTSTFSPREMRLLLAVLAIAAIAAAGPFLAQAPDYHRFADQQVRWGVPHAGDVLSNLAFVIAGVFGAWRLRLADGLGRVERSLGALACAGLVLTAFGSGWYHLQPDDTRLVADRLAMSVVFAGVLGLAACRVSARAGAALAMLVLAAAPAAVMFWSATGDLWPWAVLQGGGMVLLVVLAFSAGDRAAAPVRWGWVVAAYALAKLLEFGDHALWHAAGQWLSGHSLKHVVAALAVWPVFAAWRPALPARHNERRTARTAG